MMIECGARAVIIGSALVKDGRPNVALAQELAAQVGEAKLLFGVDSKGGKVTIAVSNFPMSNLPIDWFVPAKEALSVCVEEMKLPPLASEQ